MHGLWNNHMALREILKGRSFGQHSVENYIYSCVRPRPGLDRARVSSCSGAGGNEPISCCLLRFCQMDGEPGCQLCCCCCHCCQESIRVMWGAATTVWRSRERERAPPGTLIMSPAPPIPLETAAGCLGFHVFCWVLSPAALALFPFLLFWWRWPKFRLALDEKSWTGFAVNVAKIWPNPVCSEGSVSVQGGGGAWAACTRVAACLSTGINCLADSREATPLTNYSAVTNQDEIILGSKTSLFVMPRAFK